MRKIVFSFAMLCFICTVPYDLEAQQTCPVIKLISKKQWNELFPNRYAISVTRSGYTSAIPKKEFYGYESFIKATKRFPHFLANGTLVQKRRELAAFLANIAHETSGGWDDAPGGYYAWGLYFLTERGCERGCNNYSDTSKKKFLPVATQSYHGRGPIQLSWNYNYGQFSQFYFTDKNKLLKNPSLLEKDPILSFASAIWFWLTPQYPKPSCHEVMSGKWIPEPKDSIAGRLPGFGAVANIINGGIECGGSVSQKAAYRLAFYTHFCKYFKVDPGQNLSCATQRPFAQ